jgi:HD-GYP domain-containing protein (c-di-GMP phosphodiesterase class II)
MREITVDKLSSGQKVAEQVMTSLGGSLFAKGHVIMDQDIPILKAFFIDKVMIESPSQNVAHKSTKESKSAIENKGTVDNKLTKERKPTSMNRQVAQPKLVKDIAFEEEYHQIIKKTEKMFLNIQGGTSIPILEIRQYLIPFIQKAMVNPQLILTIPQLSNKNLYFYHHALSVALLVSILARKAGFDSKEIPQIALAGYLHNIGQLRIDPTIINKPIALTQEEFQEVQSHPSYGYQMLKKTPGISEGVILSALQHHEREDGSGYPLGFKSEKIHAYAKMVAIADIYYAMCSERIYKKAMSPFLVIEQLKNDSFGKLNPSYVHLFVEMISNQLSIGTKVILSNGRHGEIVYMDANSTTRPLVRCDEEMINLQQQRELYIETLG